jgi:hypothetical protein
LHTPILSSWSFRHVGATSPLAKEIPGPPNEHDQARGKLNRDVRQQCKSRTVLIE